MAVVGSWGDVVFSVSRGQARTFETLQWDSSAKYATHDLHLKTAILEYTGRDADSISFSMFLSAWLGIDPMQELKKLDSALKEGKSARLVVGGQSYGKFVCTKLSRELSRFDRYGGLLAVRVNVSMEEYAER